MTYSECLTRCLPLDRRDLFPVLFPDLFDRLRVRKLIAFKLVLLHFNPLLETLILLQNHFQLSMWVFVRSVERIGLSAGRKG